MSVFMLALKLQERGLRTARGQKEEARERGQRIFSAVHHREKH